MDDKAKKEEKKREEYRKFLEEEEKLKRKIEKEFAEDKIRLRKDFIRRLELERREASLNGVVLKAQEVATLQQRQLEQEEKLAAELDLLRRQEIVEMKMRQHLRENSHELKELESQLKAAYTKKAIAAQLAEKEADKLEDQIREIKAREVIEKAIGTIREQEEEERLREKIEKDKFRHLLQDQIIEKEKKRQQEFISFMKEKKMFDEILQTIKEEEVRELEEKKMMQQKIKEEMEQFYKARDMWRARERLKILEEEEKRKEINDEKDTIKVVDNTLKILREKQIEKIFNKLSQDAQEKKKKLAERDELINTLMQNAKNEEENEKMRKKQEKEKEIKEESRENYKQLMISKALKQKQEKEIDAQFARMMQAKVEEEEKKEREKQEKRRETLINNRKYNEEAMRRNVHKRAEELKLTQLINELEEKEEKRKAELIEEERMKILREHVPKLLGYIPKGCLKERDLELLGLSGNSPLPESCPLHHK